jgi:hypothetical protein
MPAQVTQLGIGSYGLLLDIKEHYPWEELPLGIQNSHEVDQLVPSMLSIPH